MITDNLAEFNAKVNAWAGVHASGASIDTIMRKFILDGLFGLVNYTPVDKGYLRFNWQVFISAPGTDTVGSREEEYAEMQPERVGKGVLASQVPGKGTMPRFGVAYIVNNAEYAEYVNDGTPKKDGVQMVERTEQDLLAQLTTTEVA